MEKTVRTGRQMGGYLEGLLESSPYAVLAINAKGKMTFVNKAALEMLECEPQDLIGKDITTVYENEEKAKETNRQLYRSSGVIRDHESVVKTNKGNLVAVRISAAHLQDGTGNYTGAVGFFESYRPWKGAETRLQEHCRQLEVEIEGWRDLGSPVFELLPGLSLTVITGHINSKRFEHLRKTILNHLTVNKTGTMVIDISMALVKDEDENEIADQLVKTARSVQLVGAKCFLTGIFARIAEALESRVADITPLNTYSSMQAGLTAALAFSGLKLTKKDD